MIKNILFRKTTLINWITRVLIFNLFLVPQVFAAKPCKILVHGDSLSSAYGFQRELGWVHLLEKQLKNKKISCEVINSSISGETSAGGLSRLPALLSQHLPSILMLELGGNDGLRGLPLSLLQQQLTRMIKMAQQEKVKVLLVGVTLPPNLGKNYNLEFTKVFQDTASQTGVLLVPTIFSNIKEDKEAFQTDGIHPKAEVQEKLLDAVWEPLYQLLKK